MPLLLGCQGLSKSFGSGRLFEGLSFTVSDGDRIGLIGPNGSGKSTLLKILSGDVSPDDGIVAPRKLLKLGYVPQQDDLPLESTVGSYLESIEAAAHHTEEEHAVRIRVTLGKAGFTGDSQTIGSLSGGWRKRLAIAAELIRDPELLMLDEPTNHLDLEGILWLEKLLSSAPFASVVVTHDRYFLERFANRIVEIRRSYPNGLFAVNGNYSEFLMRRAEFDSTQAKRRQSLENRVEREVEWLRRGAKARTSKSKARIDAAGRMIETLEDVAARSATRAVSIDFSATGRRTKRLIEAEGISKTLGGRALFRDLSFVLSPGSRLGLLGGNGSGKTTLLRMLAQRLEPDSGEIRRADGVRILYFDQHREQLDPAVSLRRALAPHGDGIIFQGQPIHVAAWAARFLFSNDQLDLPAGRLSGGERARVFIARMMLEPADVLLLDEPTNDLDIPTLEVLEDSLADFPGAVVLVTHDRYLLDRVSSLIIGLDGRGGSAVFADCSQWERELAGRPAREGAKPATARKETPPAKKLSYAEKREWERMEAGILAAEENLRAAEAEMRTVEGSSDAATMTGRFSAFERAQADVAALYERWAELESKTVVS